MIDASVSNTAQPAKCCLCGVGHDLAMNRLQCVTQTKWKSRGTAHEQEKKEFTEFSDPQVWNVVLCPACRVKSYRSFLKDDVSGTLVLVALCVLFIAIGAWCAWGLSVEGSNTTSGAKANLFFAGLGLLSVIILPIALWSIGGNLVRLAHAGNLQDVPQKYRGEAYLSAGKVVVRRLQTGQGDTVYGDFPLSGLPDEPLLSDAPAEVRQGAEKIKQERLVREISETSA